MKYLLAGIFTAGTMFASYTAYKADGFGPVLAEFEKLRAQAAQAATSFGSTQSPPVFSSGYANSDNPNALASGNLQGASDPGYAGLLLPHLQAAFSPLEGGSVQLTEEPLLRLREFFVRDRQSAEAMEAIRILDQIRRMIREREIFRLRIVESARRFEGEYVRIRIAEEWLARARELAPPYQRSYAGLFAREEEFRRRGGQAVRLHESYAEAARRDPLMRPRFEEHLINGSIAHRETGHAEANRNPIEPNRNPLQAARGAVAEYHSPLESSAGHSAMGSVNGHEAYVGGPIQGPIATRPVWEEHRGGVASAPTTHYTNPFAQPLSRPPSAVAHPAAPVAKPAAPVVHPVQPVVVRPS
jgi:hypothetical protein